MNNTTFRVFWPSNTCTLHCSCSPQWPDAEKYIQCPTLPEKSDSNENEDPDLAETAERSPDKQSADVGKKPDVDG